MYSGSVQSQPNKPDISVRRARSNVGDSTIDEDEVVASFTSISGPANETDSAIGSGFEDDDEVSIFFWLNEAELLQSVICVPTVLEVKKGF